MAPLWAVTVFYLIALVPLVLILAEAFTIDGALSLANFDSLFTDPRQPVLLLRSLTLASGATLMALAMGVPMAFFIQKAGFAGHRLLRYLHLLPLTIPPQVFVSAWLGFPALFAREIKGAAPGPFIELFSGMPAAVGLLALSLYPLVVLPTLAGLTALDQRLEDAAALVHRKTRVFLRITLPLLGPFIITGAVFVFLFALFNYSVPSLLRIPTYPMEIFAQFSAFYNEGRAAALACPLIVLALLLLRIVQRTTGSSVFFSLATGRQPLQNRGSRTARTLLAVWSWGLIFISVVLPLCLLLAQAASPQVMIAVLRTSSREILQTISGAAAAATALTLIAYPLATRIAAGRSRFWRWMDYASLFPVAVPATVLGIGLIYLWNRPYLDIVYGSGAILVIAMAARFLPFAMRSMIAGNQQVHPSLKEAALLFEASPLRRWRFIQWPLLKNSIAVGWLIGFILSMNELGATLLIIPPGQGTLSLKIYNLMHYGANQMVAGMSLLLVGINLLVAAIVFKHILSSKAWAT
jgi:iron(III) transport system permease protein